MKVKNHFVVCPECGGQMVFTPGDIPRYVCRKCRVRHRAHPDGRPTGFPGDEETRELRGEAHALLDGVYDWENRLSRAEMYDFVFRVTKKHHIGEMNKDDLKKLIAKIPRTGYVRKSLWDQVKKDRLSRGSNYQKMES